MQFGVLPPYREGVMADREWLVGFARAAEELGFESIYAIDRIAGTAGLATGTAAGPATAGGLPDDCPIPDALDLLAFLAGVTDRLVLATSVLVLPLHHPVELAKRVATVDRLSGGRLRLGVGIGGRPAEFEALGVDYPTRGARTDEIIDALRVIWASDVASFNGRHVAFDGVVCRPRTVRAGGVPIHVGGSTLAAAARAGRLGEGFHPVGLAGEDLSEALRVLWEAAVQCGRDPESVELTLGTNLDTTDDVLMAAAIAEAEAFGAVRMVLSTHERRLDDARAGLERFAERHLR
jgi:probable F420-dependent oxidoreductase